eukprot:5674784-Pyramimonas_sp.AAC.1
MERRPSSHYLRGNLLNPFFNCILHNPHLVPRTAQPKVDVLELCGGIGGVSQLAFSRGLSSGGTSTNALSLILATRRSSMQFAFSRLSC